MTNSDILFYCYWGKAGRNDDDVYHLLPYHCLDVAAVGIQLLRAHAPLRKKLAKLLKTDEETCICLVALFLAGHDVGKFAAGFQNLRPDIAEKLRECLGNEQYRLRHDILGFLLWQEHFSKALLDHSWFRSAEKRDSRRWQGVFDQWAAAAAGHHGRPPLVIDDSAEEYFGKDGILAAKSFLDALIQLFLVEFPDQTLSALDVYKGIKRCSWLLAGIAVLCDWIGSNDRYFPYEKERRDLRTYLNDSEKKALKGLKDSGVLPISAAHYSGIKKLFEKIEIPSPLQAHADTSKLLDSPQLWILEDLTGSGKTEAALILAHRIMSAGLADGLYFALPTMATANAMYDRVANAYRRLFESGSDPNLILTHSAGKLSDRFQKSILVNTTGKQDRYGDGSETAEAVCTAWLADSSKKAFLADVGVGTVDQALVSILPVRHQSLRLLGLARKVLIVDEVHAYDSYMHGLLRQLLHFHAALGGCAVLLSATLPQSTREELVWSFSSGLGDETDFSLVETAYPLVTHSSKDSVSETPISERPDQRRKVRVELLNDHESVYRLVVENAERGSCVCWIRNTVADALEAYETLSQSNFPSEKLLLFHARYAMGDRLEREEQVLEAFGKQSGSEQRNGKIIIATQVVEQSLDLDFDVMVTDLAPIDLIIQRAGRLRRHLRDHKGNPLPFGSAQDGRGEPIIYVFSPDPTDSPPKDWYSAVFEKAAYVYEDHGRLWLTARLLKSEQCLTMPHNARLLIEGVYGEEAEPIPPGLTRSSIIAQGQKHADSSLARINALDPNQGYMGAPEHWIEDTETPTRLGDAGIRITLAKWDGMMLEPWFDHGRHPWEMSRLSVRESLAKAEPKHLDKALSESISSAKESMPDKGKWSILLPLTQLDDQTWTGSALNNKGEEITLIYSQRFGLTKAE